MNETAAPVGQAAAAGIGRRLGSLCYEILLLAAIIFVAGWSFLALDPLLAPATARVLLVVPEQMSAWALYSYVQHLRENNQQTSRHEIAFWNKLIYPFAVLVMMVLALPFAYYQQRAGGVGGKVFAGIMLGIGFAMLGRLFTYLGLLRDWPPFWSAIVPTLMFLSLAVVMMWWGERR